MRRVLPGGYELDDDRGRIDRDVVHAYLADESYWARGRSRHVMDELIDGAARVVGLYRGEELVGFSRTVSDGHTVSYLADVFVLDGHRGRGLGLELVRFTVDDGSLAETKWLLHTADAHSVYAKLGFVGAGARTMERAASRSRHAG